MRALSLEDGRIVMRDDRPYILQRLDMLAGALNDTILQATQHGYVVEINALASHRAPSVGVTALPRVELATPLDLFTPPEPDTPETPETPDTTFDDILGASKFSHPKFRKDVLGETPASDDADVDDWGWTRSSEPISLLNETNGQEPEAAAD
jgi:hypothetical protein